MNHAMNENEKFVNAFHSLACYTGSYADLASSEATINEVNRGRIKTGREKEERWRKKFYSRFSKGKR